jgi:hypothetical protein
MEFSVCYLTEQHRQQDNTLLSLLDKIRSNEIDEDVISILNSRLHQKLDLDITPTKLYTHNIDVDRINDLELAKINTPEHIFDMSTK